MNLINAFLDYTSPVNLPHRFRLWSAISLVSALTQRRIFLSEGPQPLYANLFVLLIGEPGSGKTQSIRYVQNVLRTLNKSPEVLAANSKLFFNLTQATPAALIAKMVQLRQELSGFNGYKSIIQSPIYLLLEEASTFLKDIGGGQSVEELLNLFDCPHDFHKETRSFGAEVIEAPYLTILGAATPGTFNRFMNSEAKGAGLTARFIFPVVSAKEETSIDLEKQLDLNLFNVLQAHAKRIMLLKGYAVFSPEAKALTRQFHAEYEACRKGATSSSPQKDYFTRKILMVKKLALLLSVADSSDLLVAPAHVQSAHDYVSDLENSIFSAYDKEHVTSQNPRFISIVEKCLPAAPGTYGLEQIIVHMGTCGYSISRQDLSLALSSIILPHVEIINRPAPVGVIIK